MTQFYTFDATTAELASIIERIDKTLVKAVDNGRIEGYTFDTLKKALGFRVILRSHKSRVTAKVIVTEDGRNRADGAIHWLVNNSTTVDAGGLDHEAVNFLLDDLRGISVTLDSVLDRFPIDF